MKKEKFYAIQQYGREADVYIFGDITDYAWFDDETSPQTFKNDVENLDADTIRLHINCYGGSVAAGWAIYSTLRQHKAKVQTYADGFVCSAALYPFLAGDERYAQSVSAFYLHEVSTGAWGYAKDLRAAADEAEKLTEIGINAFVERAGMARETVEQLMERETWLTPEEALSYGIVTEILKEDDGGASQSALKDIMQKLFVSDDKKPAPIEEHNDEPPIEQKTEEPVQEEPVQEQPTKSLFQSFAGIFNV